MTRSNRDQADELRCTLGRATSSLGGVPAVFAGTASEQSDRARSKGCVWTLPHASS